MSKSIKLDNNNYLDSTSVAVDQNNLYDELFYKSGDTLTFNNQYNTGGTLTSSNKNIYFTVVTPKRLDNISSISASGSVYIHHADGGYIANNVDISTLGTVTYTKTSQNAFRILLSLSTACSYTNNSVVAIMLDSGFTFTFT